MYLRHRKPRVIRSRRELAGTGGAVRRELAGTGGAVRRELAGTGGAVRRKLARTGGFSLAETMLCCLILALSTATLARTMALAGEQFNTRTRESDARILCNTLSQAVQDYLSCATGRETDDDGVLLSFETGAIPSREEPVRCTFTTSREGYLALDYSGSGTNLLLLAPAADYVPHDGRATLAAECAVWYSSDSGYFTVSVHVYPNPGGALWDAKMQEVLNEFIVIPIPSPLPEI